MIHLALTKLLPVGALAALLLGCGSTQQSSQSSVPSMPSSSSSSGMPSMPSSGSSSSSGMPTMPSSSSQSGTGTTSMPSSGGATSAGVPSSGAGNAGIPGANSGTPGISGSGAGIPSTGQRDGVGGPGTSGGNYDLDNLPGSSGDGASGPMTAQERAAVLSGTLNDGYQDFDGFILDERARAQAAANATRGPSIIGDSGSNGAAGGGSTSGPIISSARGNGAGQQSPGIPGTSNSNSAKEDFPAPDDIPSGRDDDIVARQLREAATQEPDPELREKLWDEYRKYTGTGK